MRMTCNGLSSRKCAAVIHRFRSKSPFIFIREHFDSGKGSSNAFTSRDTTITEEIFQEALDAGLIRPKPEPGYMSTTEFIVTELGEQTQARNEHIAAIALSNLYPGKGMRACDICIYVPRSSEEEVGAILDDLVRRGYAAPGEQGEQKFYFLAEHHAATARAIAA